MEREVNEAPTEISNYTGHSKVTTTGAGVELKSPGATLLLNSEGLSVRGPSLSVPVPVYFNRFACHGLPVELYGGPGKTYFSNSFFSC